MSRPGRPAPVGLADLVGDVDVFARCHWGRHPRLQRASDGSDGADCPDRPDLADVLSVADVDRYLASAPRRPTVRLVRDGAPLDPSSYCAPVRLGGQTMTDVIDPGRVTALYLEGATVVLQSLHRTWRPVGELVAGLAAELSHPVQANAYLSPPGGWGLAAHEDRHDVLVIHCHGTKQWHVAGLGELILEPGDVLYLPAGTGHRASAGHQPSLHLTLGVIPDTARHVVERLVARTPGLDRRLPLGYRRRPAAEPAPELVAELGAVAAAARALAAADPVAVADEVLLRRPAPPVPPASLGAVVATATLGLDARLVCRHPDVCAVTPAGAGQLALAYRGGLLRMPAHLAPALERLLTGTPVALAELPGLDDDSRLVLARRLAAEGVVDVIT